MSELKIFENKEFGEVRSFMIDDEPWFVGKDVAEALGYKNANDALSKRIDEDDKGVANCDTLGGVQELVIINESGLYSLIFSSKLESAKKFKHWVTSEVLPSIRKSGKYMPVTTCPSDPIIASSVAALARVTERIMKNQGSAPYKIAETFEFQCKQFGIQLPSKFVEVPDHEQMRFDVFDLVTDYE